MFVIILTQTPQGVFRRGEENNQLLKEGLDEEKVVCLCPVSNPSGDPCLCSQTAGMCTILV